MVLFRWKSDFFSFYPLKISVVNGPGPNTQINALFIDIWSFEWLVCSVRLSFFTRNHAIVSCYATARPGISAWSNKQLPPFMWKASWHKFQPSQSKERVLDKGIRHNIHEKSELVHCCRVSKRDITWTLRKSVHKNLSTACVPGHTWRK